MLQKMRDNAQGTAARILVGIIVFVLAVFGFGAFDFFTPGEPVVATVNDSDITQTDLFFEAERRKQSLLAQFGPDADPSLIDDVQLRAVTLGSLINRELILQAADSLDVAISEERLNKDLVDNPNFALAGLFAMFFLPWFEDPQYYTDEYGIDGLFEILMWGVKLLTAAFGIAATTCAVLSKQFEPPSSS